MIFPIENVRNSKYFEVQEQIDWKAALLVHQQG
jgi:hypothetical protein